MASSQRLPAGHVARNADKARATGKRPLNFRANSESATHEDQTDQTKSTVHARHRSTATPTKLAKLSVKPVKRSPRTPLSPVFAEGNSDSSPRSSLDDQLGRVQTPSTSTPPTTPDQLASEFDVDTVADDSISFDFTKIDYELERARKLGSGLWSDVFLSVPTPPKPAQANLRVSPKIAPTASAPVFAVKMPARPDANAVLRHEAKILSFLQRHIGSSQYIVPFLGLDQRNSALVFEAVIGGSMDDLINRLKQMTEVARHQELVSIFPGLANDLISGLEYIHGAGVVHADIKPANILLDVSDHYSLPAPVIRARYIDFSAAFITAQDDGPTNAGGTWDYMAPEQLRIQKDLNTPTYASDIWSLGISLLSVITLGSPYADVCAGNAFMLREAIKTGDPMGFARAEPKVKKRMDACQEFVDCCKFALQKDRERRGTATAWKRWLQIHGLDEYTSLAL